MLRDVQDDARLFAATAYTEHDLAELVASLEAPADPGRDTEPAAPPARPKTKTGELIELGAHRLLCGDSATALGDLVGEETVDLLLTDPPYGVEYTGGPQADRKAIAGDTLADLEALLAGALGAACEHARPGAAAYVFHADTAGLVFRTAFIGAGWDMKQALVWVKQQFVLGRQDYQWKHEPILYGWKPGAAHGFYGGRAQSTVLEDGLDLDAMTKGELKAALAGLLEEIPTSVLEEDRPHRSDLHPTMKPVELIARLMTNSSMPGETVLDPFGGSGSTLIAAENTGRRALLMEVDPGYCDVIVDRWERHTGEKATRPARPRRTRATA